MSSYFNLTLDLTAPTITINCFDTTDPGILDIALTFNEPVGSVLTGTFMDKTGATYNATFTLSADRLSALGNVDLTTATPGIGLLTIQANDEVNNLGTATKNVLINGEVKLYYCVADYTKNYIVDIDAKAVVLP